MTTWLVTRHPGARDWADQQQLAVDRWCVHLDPGEIAVGDTVIGSLPVNLAAAVCAAGARYLNLSIDLPAHARGKELSADDLARFNARLEEFHAERLATNHPIAAR
jgi:CRISPR-associated protein Csx16